MDLAMDTGMDTGMDTAMVTAMGTGIMKKTISDNPGTKPSLIRESGSATKQKIKG